MTLITSIYVIISQAVLILFAKTVKAARRSAKSKKSLIEKGLIRKYSNSQWLLATHPKNSTLYDVVRSKHNVKIITFKLVNA